ncbi:hypothetical protein AAW12_24030 [Sphingobacterium sp. Ag1]|nr:hypothetical protein AAW12_24030 [Sphingobacterium sp. Ag1]
MSKEQSKKTFKGTSGIQPTSRKRLRHKHMPSHIPILYSVSFCLLQLPNVLIDFLFFPVFSFEKNDWGGASAGLTGKRT